MILQEQTQPSEAGLVRHLGSSLRSPVEVEGNECFPPQPKKDLESPSYMVFPVVMYGCKSWTIKKAECR